jgi:iron complex outermembrane receptor protein
MSTLSLARRVRRPLAATAVAFLLPFVCPPQKSWAQSVLSDQNPSGGLKHLNLEELGNVEVTTASKVPNTVWHTPAAIYVLTQEDIRRSGATSLPEVLRLVPGVEVARTDSDTWALGVRGFGSTLSRSVLVLIDGRTVYTPLFAGVYWQVQDTLLEDIERIEVIRGPGGTIWGANAVNAVINIITKPAKDTRGLLVSVGGGTVDQGFVGFRYGAAKGQNFDYRVYGKAFTRGPEFHRDHQQFDDWRMGQIGFRTDWSAHGRDTFALQGDLYNEDAGQNVGIAIYSPPGQINVQQNAELSGGNLLGRWQRRLEGGSDIQVRAYYDRTNRRQPNFAESRDTLDVDFLHHLTLPGRQSLLWGLGLRLSSGNASEVVPTIQFIPNHRTDKLYSGFVQDEFKISENQLSLIIGAKFLHNIYTGFEVQPSARLLWTPTTRQSLWAAVTRAVRTPSRIEEDDKLTVAPAPPTFLRIIGDGKFSSEKMIGYELGYRSLVTPKFYVDVATFYNNYDRLLSVEPGVPFSEASPPPTHLVVPLFFRNGLLGTAYGFEVAPDWTPVSWWHLKGSYSFLHLDIRTGKGSLDTSTPASIEGTSPQHQVVVQSFFNLPGRLEFDQTYRYVSALPAQNVKSYGTADVRLGWHLNRAFELSLVGQNLLQPDHAEFGGDPGPLVGIKRCAYGKITWTK